MQYKYSLAQTRLHHWIPHSLNINGIVLIKISLSLLLCWKVYENIGLLANTFIILIYNTNGVLVCFLSCRKAHKRD